MYFESSLVIRFRWLLAALILGFSIAGLGVTPALAQGCAMCYSTARSTPKDAQRTINRGIFVMLVPPLVAMTLGVGAAFRYGKQRDRENGASSDTDNDNG
jgi:hypothetical protein